MVPPKQNLGNPVFEAAKKFWSNTADKWMEAGAIRMGAGELVANKMWNALAAPVIDYDPS